MIGYRFGDILYKYPIFVHSEDKYTSKLYETVFSCPSALLTTLFKKSNVN